MKTKPSVDQPEPWPEVVNLSVVPSGEPGPLGSEEVAKEAVACIKSGMNSARKSWKKLMEGSLRLIWLQQSNKAQGARNDIVPDGRKSGFNQVLNEVNVPATTAYRWIAQAKAFIAEIGISETNLPTPGTDEWSRMERFVLGKVDLLSLLKLPIRADALPKDDEVITRLRTAAERGDQVAGELLDQLAAGEILLDEATRRYCRAEVPKRPIRPMLTLDPKTLKAKGRLVGALDTLEKCFAEWQCFEPEARIQAAGHIRAVLAKMPNECAFSGF